MEAAESGEGEREMMHEKFMIRDSWKNAKVHIFKAIRGGFSPYSACGIWYSTVQAAGAGDGREVCSSCAQIAVKRGWV